MSGCGKEERLGGAIPTTEYLAILAEVGFTDVTEVGRHDITGDELAEMARCPGPDYAPTPEAADVTAADGQVYSLKFTAHKPR